MILYQKSKYLNQNSISQEDCTVSSLLIPEYLLESFRLKISKYNGNTTFYLASLLRRFRSITHTGLLPEANKIKTEYQASRLNLKKVSFRPRNRDWIELGALALAFGKSRCWIFTYLLNLDLLGLWSILVEAKMNKVVPTLPNLELKIFWNLERVKDNFARGYKLRV